MGLPAAPERRNKGSHLRRIRTFVTGLQLLTGKDRMKQTKNLTLQLNEFFAR
jgi:hypothetical protein